MALHSSPFQARNSSRSRRNEDSPSRQLQFELERAFSQIHLQEVERQKLHAYQRRQQCEELDAKESAKAEAHRAELNVATAQHEIVRQQAEAVLQAYLKQEEEERRRREEERRRQEEEARRRHEEEQARKRAEQERKEREERERREREQRAREEAERYAINERQKAEAQKAEAEAEANKRKEEETARRKQQEEQAKAEQEARTKKVEAAATASAPIPPRSVAPTPVSSKSSTTEAEHQNYLAIHKKLKRFRSEFWEKVKKDPSLKPHVGDMRRAIKTSVGQLTDDKVGNKKAHDRVRLTLHKALNEVPSPPVPVSDYLPAHLSLHDGGETTVPSLVLYLLSMFSKAIINAFVGECAVNSKAGEPIGTLVAQIFSMPELQFSRRVAAGSAPSSESLISILMCKFHASAPALFGVYGPETTSGGRRRIGWRLDEISDGKKAFVTENKHYDRQTGLGIGYASIALRNFSRTRFSNPWPPIHFWSSLAHIVNTPSSEVQTTHLILLKSMLENNAIDRFVLFFGAAAIAALRQALIEFPRTLPREMQEKPISKALGLMIDAWKTEKHFRLD
ncbi:hypothetical protein LTR10_011590 [Elasticomyces elasticus]|uniref:mRNA export factor GLE1 n=1 Tax=Exophiala sideris TaxID=1016849 RepID=A0ABR0JD70_9EURO|nr:hypothetical protein LTR10_011590 [Elasticomyces elasticus]KAK5031951.1 hypothetical protein LTS07_004572 [Exophiala sideris]KAK5040880.1 hypothetical protein LTR13_003181 [Exophiala sideris]KAK5061785.1 hypothetical protein LTR69_004968 [Exophiala sideris]KAK5184485.1 hypothetical protein LTR44_003159 [Eurotiomycetes sp. CCFEE 6388]